MTATQGHLMMNEYRARPKYWPGFTNGAKREQIYWSSTVPVCSLRYIAYHSRPASSSGES